MRIVYFHQHFSNRMGATGTRSYEFARKLVSRGHHVTLVCGSAALAVTGVTGPFIKGQRRGIVDGINVIEIAIPYSNQLGFTKRVLAFLSFAWRSTLLALNEPCDLIFATSTPLTAGIPGIAAAWFRRTPFVFEVRDLWPELPRAMGVITNPLLVAMMSVLEWLSYRTAVACIALSPGIAEGISRRGKPVEAVHVIPNGCDLELFDVDTFAAWRPPGVSADDFMAVFPGAHGIANGLDALLDAAAELQRRANRSVKIVLVGDGTVKPRLVARARDEGLANVRFLDPLPKPHLAGLLAAADVGLMTLMNVPAFYRGTSPNKFFDFIAAGKPVIINYPGWLAEKVAAHECGLVVAPEDARAFADTLIYAAEHRCELKTMGRNARELAEREFDRRRLASQFVALLEEVTMMRGECMVQDQDVGCKLIKRQSDRHTEKGTPNGQGTL